MRLDTTAGENLHAQVRSAGGAGAVAAVEVRCHPLVPELTGNPDPGDGLQARFSTVHGVAAGLLLGTVDLAAYADDFVVSAEATGLRSKVTLVARPTP